MGCLGVCFSGSLCFMMNNTKKVDKEQGLNMVDIWFSYRFELKRNVGYKGSC